ncbi:hypothetical protein L195_g063517, partial [Trifolium pratense]
GGGVDLEGLGRCGFGVGGGVGLESEEV